MKLIALLASVVLATSPIPQARAAQTRAISEAARSAWGFTDASVAPHPEVRFGVLPNGMRYALMRNAAPAGSLSVRMRVDVGAAAEGEREQGFAHLVEHMIFHGSQNIPEGALPMLLSQQGLKRWSDFGAYTSYDETVFQLDLGKADRGARETALELMREIASRLRFARGAVKGAKRKVEEEIRGRDAIGDRVMTAENGLYLPGTRIARGPVAGTVENVRRVQAEELRRFYERHYAPSAVTLVLVGDIDPAAVEAEIGQRFGDWSGAAEPRRRASGSVNAAPDTQARLFIDPAAPTSVTIASVSPLDAAGDTAPSRDAHFLERMGSEMLSRRLARIGAAGDAPFVTASAAIYDHFSTARLSSVELAARDRDWRAALDRGGAELRRALLAGFSQAELDEQLAAARGALAGDARPRTESELADAIISAVGRGIVFTVPADPAAASAYLSRVRLADVNAAFRAAWSRGGRRIFVAHHRKVAGGEAAVVAAWNRGGEEAADLRHEGSQALTSQGR
jgi:zinc protease